MASYNKNFELTVDDIDLIETALRRKKRALNDERMSAGEPDAGDVADTVREIHDLLGRLHNQKRFYRPKTGVYVGG